VVVSVGKGANGEGVAGVLARLGEAADRYCAGWVPRAWYKVAGPGPDRLETREVGAPRDEGGLAGLVLDGLTLQPGGDLTLSLPLELPPSLGEVYLAGDPLELTVNSIYPVGLSANGRRLFDDDLPLVASGPAVVEVLERIEPGPNGHLEAVIRAPDNQLADMGWTVFHFTTPALRARFELLDLAWAQLYLADQLAGSADERKAVDVAALRVPEQLVTDDGAGLAAALGEMAEALAPLAARVAQLSVHIVGHSHIDLAWLWTRRDTARVLERDARSVLAMLDDYPEMTFTHSQPAGYQVIGERAPDLLEAIRSHVAAGRWEPATMQWVEADANLISGESAARQLLEGVLYSREVLGRSPTVLLAPDTFGHAGNLPQLAASAGARAYYHHRCNPGSKREGPWPAYWWEGDDASRILAVSTPSYNNEVTASALARTAITLGHEHGLSQSLLVVGVGDHGGGPTRRSVETLRRLHEQPLLPQTLWSTVAAFAGDVLSSGAALPTHRGESDTTFEGCYSTHADAKGYNRHAEALLGSAETLAVLAGVDRRATLTEAWRSTLYNQFHDIIAGSSIADVYADYAHDFAAVKATADDVLDDALSVLHREVADGSIAVTNPLGFEREDVVVLPGMVGTEPVRLSGSHGHETWGQPGPDGLCFVARVPAFAIRSVGPPGRSDP
jgi:alpha-mannosidase